MRWGFERELRVQCAGVIHSSAALKVLADRGEAESALVEEAMAEYGIDPDAPDPSVS